MGRRPTSPCYHALHGLLSLKHGNPLVLVCQRVMTPLSFLFSLSVYFISSASSLAWLGQPEIDPDGDDGFPMSSILWLQYFKSMA